MAALGRFADSAEVRARARRNIRGPRDTLWPIRHGCGAPADENRSPLRSFPSQSAKCFASVALGSRLPNHD